METGTVEKKKLKVAPELRFQEFEEGWKKVRLGELGQFKGGGTPDTKIEKYWKGEIPWISSSDIYEGDIHNINIRKWINIKAIKETATKVIPKESILLISRVGVGKLAINKIEICTSQDFSNFLPKDNSSYFLGYYLISRKNLLLGFAQGTSIKGFTTSDIKNLKLDLPSLPEQQKIASFLSAVDKKIQQLTRKKELLENFKRGVMQQLFSQEIRFKGEGGKNFPQWEEKKLSEVCEIVGGGTPNTNTENYWNGGINWFTPTEIKQKYVFKSSRMISKLGLNNSSGKLLPKNSILFTTRASIGQLAIAMEECATNQGFQSFLPNKNYSTSFLYYSLLFNRKAFIRRSSGSTFSEISKAEVQKIKLDFPSPNEQQKIADFLSAIDKKIEAVSKQIEKTQSFKKGLLQQMFV